MTPLVTFTWPDTAISIGVLLLVTLVARVILRRAIRAGVAASISVGDRHRAADSRTEQLIGRLTGTADARHQARVRTLGSVMTNAVDIILVLLVVLTILRIGNQSQGWSTGTVDVPIATGEDTERAIAVLREVTAQVFADEKYAEVLLEEPNVAGVDKVVAGTTTIRIFAKTAPNQHWGVQRDLLERSVAALRRAGIKAPTLPPYGSPTA